MITGVEDFIGRLVKQFSTPVICAICEICGFIVFININV